MPPLRVLAAGLLTALLLACSPGNTPKPPVGALLPQDPNGNFVLYVSNQSFAISPVDITISIDGTKAIQDDFDVKNQHHYVQYQFHLAPGKHILKADSSKGGAALAQEFEVKDKHWAAIEYWYYPAVTGGAGPTPKSFVFVVKDTPIGFD